MEPVRGCCLVMSQGVISPCDVSGHGTVCVQCFPCWLCCVSLRLFFVLCLLMGLVCSVAFICYEGSRVCGHCGSARPFSFGLVFTRAALRFWPGSVRSAIGGRAMRAGLLGKMPFVRVRDNPMFGVVSVGATAWYWHSVSVW